MQFYSGPLMHFLSGVDNPTATRVYAWSSPIEWSTKRRFFAVLHQPRVDSPQAALRALFLWSIKARRKRMISAEKQYEYACKQIDARNEYIMAYCKTFLQLFSGI